MAFNSSSQDAIKITADLGTLVANRITAVQAVRKREQALSESRFQQAVVEQGLTYEAQIEYRKKQIEDEGKKISQDKEYIASLQKSLADVRKLKKFRDIREDYLASYESLKAGKTNLQQHQEFLTSQISSVTDEDMRKELREELTKVRTEIRQAEIDTVNNRIQIAQKDGTVFLLQNTINEVSKQKAFADLAGNEEESSAWEFSLVNLRQQLEQTKVVQAVHDIDLEVTRKGGTAIQKLERLNNEINFADSSTPIKIDGREYGSASEFWSQTRDKYLAGAGSGVFENFFAEFNQQVQNKISTASRINTFGFVPLATLDAVKRDYETLAQKAEFQPYLETLNNSQIANLSYGVELSSKALVESSVATLQLNTGLAKLNDLQTRYGIDTSTQRENLNQQIISKGSQLPSIKQAGENLAKVGAETPAPEVPKGTTPKEVFQTNVQPQKAPVDTQITTPKASTNKVPYTELLSLLKPEQIVRQGSDIFLAEGTTAPYRKLSSPDELKGLTEQQLIRPKGSQDIFVKL